MAENQQERRADHDVVHLVQSKDGSTEFSERGGKGLDSPRGPRPPATVAPPPAQAQGATSSADAAQPPTQQSTAQQNDRGPVNYDG
jgi:hypothetical protein